MSPKLPFQTIARLRNFSAAVLSAAALCAIASSCAAPGQPTPPHPPIPQPVNDLVARQRGSSVALTFTLPAKTTRGAKLPGPPSVEIYRAPSTASANKAPKLQIVSAISAAAVSQTVQEGRAELLTPIPVPAPAGQPYTFSVRTSVSKNHDSADSNLVTLNIFPPPSTPTDLRADVTESAIILRWSGAPSAFNVYRCEAAPSPLSRPPQVPACAPASPAKLVGDSNAPSFRDSQFTFGNTYIYTVRAVANPGPAQIDSDDSSPLVVTPKDVFPPSAPAGLVASVIPATESSTARVELSWEINAETDLAGYVVYRSEGQDSTGQRLTPRLLLAPAFRDITVSAGKKYLYRVSAVDRAGNESKLSSPVEVDVPQP